jgi:hypothetical protein
LSKRKKRLAQAPGQEPAPRRQRFALIAALGGLVAVLVVAIVAFAAMQGGSDSGSTNHPAKSAVIIDQLQLTQPNPEFVSNVREVMAQGGYEVDYVQGENVTVDFYRTLPQRGYDLILLRVHAGITTEVDAETGEKSGTEYVSLFTGEPYDASRYSQEQLNRLGKATYTDGGDPLFGIGPAFVEDSMDGNFGGATVVMMGCDGLRSQRTAQAFLDRGADAFVSWSKPVSAPHTDAATDKLLRRLVIDGLSLEDAVAATATEVGPDPHHEGELRLLTG